MAFSFTPADSSPYEPGSLFLGYSDTGREIGIKSERHFLTIAGSGGGKGTGLIIPNILRYPHNLLVIDPGGGNARATWEAREAMGQEVHIIDPTRVSQVRDKYHEAAPARLLKSFNPIANLDPANLTYAEDLNIIADGHVRRYDPAHGTWDNNGQKIIAGTIDYLKRHYVPEDHTLTAMRELLIGAPDALKATFEKMAKSPGAAARHAANIGLTDIQEPNGMIGNAQQNTEWLDYTSIKNILSDSTCDLADLKTKPCTIFLCVDPNYMDEYSRFLRLFVRMAVAAMTAGGENGRECLFILDEFYSLGRIEYLKVVAATMRKTGVHLWPILQIASQLPDLYGPDGAQSFFGGADAHIFFNNEADGPALTLISNRLGTITPEDTGAAPPVVTPRKVGWLEQMSLSSPAPPGPSLLGALLSSPKDRHSQSTAALFQAFSHMSHGAAVSAHSDAQFEFQQKEKEHAAKLANQRAEYEHAMRNVGRPRLSPDEIALLTGKGDGDIVARSMIVFASGGRVFNVRLAPYFRPPPTATEVEAAAAPPVATRRPFYASDARVFASLGGGFLGMCATVTIVPESTPGIITLALLVLGTGGGFLWGIKWDDARHAKQGGG